MQFILLVAVISVARIATAAPQMFPIEQTQNGCPSYNRALYGGWLDADKDCQNTRHEVLERQAEGRLTFKTNRGCRVSTGAWQDPYSGRTFHSASELDIDHLVPLKEAHESGAYAWDSARRRAFANALVDPNHLLAVSRSLNRTKGAKDPADWLPPNERYHEFYARAWVKVKRAWGLTADARELSTLRQILGPDAPLPRKAPEVQCARRLTPIRDRPFPTHFRCANKRKCAEMVSCQEAIFYLTQCGRQRLDGDKDGIPCERLCK